MISYILTASIHQHFEISISYGIRLDFVLTQVFLCGLAEHNGNITAAQELLPIQLAGIRQLYRYTRTTQPVYDLVLFIKQPVSPSPLTLLAVVPLLFPHALLLYSGWDVRGYDFQSDISGRAGGDAAAARDDGTA